MGCPKLERLQNNQSPMEVVGGNLLECKKGCGNVLVIKDHLGSTRVLFTDVNNNGAVDASEIVNQFEYYPFGKLQEGSWDSDSKFRYLYNGKERQNRLGLGYNRFEARFSDPYIGGRFLAVDPIAEDFAFINPYNYAENSPVVNIDLHGLQLANVKTQLCQCRKV